VVDRVLHHGVRAVICGSFYDDSTDLRRLFPQYAEHPRVSFVNRVVLPDVGRASKQRITAEKYPHTDLVGGDTCYKRLFHDVTVFWDGEVYPCCSVYNRQTPGISYGNVYDSPLADIWDRIAGSLFLRFIKRQGLSALVALLRAEAPDLAPVLPELDRTIGPCHVCNLLMRDPAIARRVHEIFDREERRRVRELLGSIRSNHGDAAAEAVMQAALAP
jgi:hypothetical protein